MKKIVITESNKHIFVEGELASGIGININKDETTGEVDASSVSSKDWDKLKKEKDTDIILEEVEKIKKKLSK